MRAAILAVGSEMLGTHRLDTNSLELTAVLQRYGVELRAKSVVGDSEAEIAAEIRSHLSRADLVLVTGGLGPTADDVTREAVAAVLGRGVRIDEAIAAAIEARFRSFGRVMPAVNRRQAEVIDGATVIANPRGTAPGQRVEHDGRTIFLFPGVPHELRGMIERDLIPWLAVRADGVARETAVLKVAGLPESTVEERIRPAYDEFGREAITILAKPGEIRLEATAEGADGPRRALLERMSARLAELAGPAVFALREEETLESVVVDLLWREGATLALAESCTGGLIAERITSVPGSSEVFEGGAVTYSNRQKERLLDVPAALLEAHGAVSEPVALAMAEGARRRFGTRYAIGVTGIAGPSGGSDDKPVGLVHLAVVGPDEGDRMHRRIRFPGDRAMVRQQASQLGLEMLRRRLLGLPAVDGAEAVGSDGMGDGSIAVGERTDGSAGR